MSVFDDLKNILKEAKEKKVDVSGILYIKPYEWIDVYEVKIQNSSFVCDCCLKETDTYGVFCEKCQSEIKNL